MLLRWHQSPIGSKHLPAPPSLPFVFCHVRAGATLTMYHLGVVKALFQAGLLPRVISGSSGGSVVAAWVCTARDEEILERLNSGGIRLGPFETISVGSLRRKVRRARPCALVKLMACRVCLRRDSVLASSSAQGWGVGE